MASQHFSTQKQQKEHTFEKRKKKQKKNRKKTEQKTRKHLGTESDARAKGREFETCVRAPITVFPATKNVFPASAPMNTSVVSGVHRPRILYTHIHAHIHTHAHTYAHVHVHM